MTIKNERNNLTVDERPLNKPYIKEGSVCWYHAKYNCNKGCKHRHNDENGELTHRSCPSCGNTFLLLRQTKEGLVPIEVGLERQRKLDKRYLGDMSNSNKPQHPIDVVKKVIDEWWPDDIKNPNAAYYLIEALSNAGLLKEVQQ